MRGWLPDDRRPLDWNGPVDRPVPDLSDGATSTPIAEWFEQVVRRGPDRIAIDDGADTLTYAQLWDGVRDLAASLAAETAPGQLVGIVMPACPMFPLAMLACLAAGRPFAALDTHYPDVWRARVLADAQPSVLVSVERDGATGRGGTGTLVISPGPAPASTGPPPGPGAARERRPVRRAPEGWRPTPSAADEPACVLFTSGSTGRPKGIVNSQRNLLQRVVQSIGAARIGPDDRFLTLASPCTIVGVRDALTALLAGAAVRLIEPRDASARDVLGVLDDAAITILFAFPGLLRTVLAGATGPAPPTLRLVRAGGDTLLWRDVDRLRDWLAPGADVQLVYAATEAPMLQWFVDDASRGEDARVPIGYVLPANRLAIVDDADDAVPPGAVGELVTAGPYVMLGRWVAGRCAPVEEVHVGDARQRIFRTGDLARQRPDGLVERVGRKDRQVKIRGVRVDLDGVEAALRDDPTVRDVAALARVGGEEPAAGAGTLVAYVAPAPGAPAEWISQLRSSMRSLPAAMRPARYYPVAEIPRLPSSKLDVGALAALDETTARNERAARAAPPAAGPDPSDHLARTVARVWTDVLDLPPAGPDDDFFDAGGDSLRAVALVVGLEAALGLELPLSLLYEAPRFGQLCASLRHGGRASGRALVVLKAGAAAEPPVFVVHGVGGTVADLLPTARRMAWTGEVIGVQARGLAPGERPRTSIGAMADAYLAEITARRPHGPYLLCGYSLGGLVAFEIAGRLTASGEEVGFVGLLDTLGSPLRWSPRVWAMLARRGVSRLAAELRSVALRSRPAEVRDLVRRLRAEEARLLAVAGHHRGLLEGSTRTAAARIVYVAAGALLASARYRPGVYDGHLTLFTPAARGVGLPPIGEVWHGRAASVSVVGTAGNHLTMLSPPHAGTTAAAITDRLPVTAPPRPGPADVVTDARG